MNAGQYFNHAGNQTKGIEYYFNEDSGEILEPISEYIYENYKSFPVTSDLVLLYFADRFASETHGNYKTQTLFTRAKA